MSLLLSGNEVAKFYKHKIQEEVKTIFEKTKKKPGIACILVGDDPASQIYVRNKEKTSQKLGIHSEIHKLSQTISQSELLSLIDKLNNADHINGILVQLPLPKHIDEQKIFLKI